MGMRVDVSGCCVVSVAHEVLYVFRLHVGPGEKSGGRVSGRVRRKVPLDAGALERGSTLAADAVHATSIRATYLRASFRYNYTRLSFIYATKTDIKPKKFPKLLDHASKLVYDGVA